ncbi:hypothetical protein [Aureimonas ureilytica]|uniref:hypothetical protein n=1 Tax=Aureimonas ureilytica TaxID=401562 RepID=UPI00037D3279|nr:hypothetical protein [Aureimonas ureilytica]
MSYEERTVFGLEAPLRLVASHDIARPGFQSARRGEFVLLDASSQDATEIIFRDLTILGVPLTKFVIQSPSGDTRLLRVDFDHAMTEADAFSFIQRFADAWSATLADGQHDPWYGNLYVDIRWAGVKTITARSGGVEASTQITSIERVAVAPALLSVLRWSPLTDVFVEGMKASQPKSKFLFWFVILEELEKREEILSLFTPMFSAEDKAKLQDAVRSNIPALQRLNGLLKNPTTTLEGRAAKLARTVEAVGGSSIDGLSGPILVDQARCAALIEQRNKVAHKGSSIDKDLLYTVLFPLSRIALKYILDRDAETVSEPQS